jgi:hypothetical protein
MTDQVPHGLGLIVYVISSEASDNISERDQFLPTI